MAKKNVPCDVHFSCPLCQQLFRGFFAPEAQNGARPVVSSKFFLKKNEPSQNCGLLEQGLQFCVPVGRKCHGWEFFDRLRKFKNSVINDLTVANRDRPKYRHCFSRYFRLDLAAL